MNHRQSANVQGSVLEYLDTGGNGPVVVLLHGALMDESLWTGVIERWGPAYRCIVPVLPMGGHRVPMPATADLSPTGLADLVAELIEVLDLHDVTLVGNDTGGALAQLLVTRHPERVSRLVLVSCDAFDNFPPGLPGRLMALLCKIPGAMWAAMVSLRIPVLRRLPMTFGWMSRRPIPDEVISRWLDAYLASSAVRADVRRFMSRVDHRDLTAAAEGLRRFHRPALIVWAEEDRVMPVDHASRLAACLPDSRVELVPDSYTLVPLDRPELLADLITDDLEART
jgi:pimeloyl-ACP methyl ester carboxylesterase